jgi:hypothetical protein
LPGTRQLESDPSILTVDEDGTQLLKHARVYTLAEKFSVPGLKSLSQTKIHCINSTAKGEIAYARYVYANTEKGDTKIREPVAHFWATRSHTLRAEAEAEFRSLCLEYPQFGYDVLSTLLLPTHRLSRNGGPNGIANGVKHSARPRREAQARAKRENGAIHAERPEACSAQQQRIDSAWRPLAEAWRRMRGEGRAHWVSWGAWVTTLMYVKKKRKPVSNSEPVQNMLCYSARSQCSALRRTHHTTRLQPLAAWSMHATCKSSAPHMSDRQEISICVSFCVVHPRLSMLAPIPARHGVP